VCGATKDYKTSRHVRRGVGDDDDDDDVFVQAADRRARGTDVRAAAIPISHGSRAPMARFDGQTVRFGFVFSKGDFGVSRSRPRPVRTTVRVCFYDRPALIVRGGRADRVHSRDHVMVNRIRSRPGQMYLFARVRSQPPRFSSRPLVDHFGQDKFESNISATRLGWTELELMKLTRLSRKRVFK